MPGERDAENLRVALMSYDDRELRIRKFYLEEQSTIIRCTCFQSGEPVLQALRQERCFDVLVLSSQLEDMDSLTFLEKLNRLPSHPPLLLQGDGWADDITAAHLQPGSRFYGVGHDHLRDLLDSIGQQSTKGVGALDRHIARNLGRTLLGFRLGQQEGQQRH